MTLVDDFIAITNASKAQALQFLEMANNNVNDAVMLFFDSGVEPEYDAASFERAPSHAEPSKGAGPIPQPLPNVQPAKKPSEHVYASEKPSQGFFSRLMGKRANEPQVGAAQHQSREPSSQPPAQPQLKGPPAEKPTKKEKFASMAAMLNNDPDHNDTDTYAGNNTKIRHAPNNVKDVQIERQNEESGAMLVLDFYHNGFLVNNHPPFYSFDNAEAEKLLEEMKTNHTIPQKILDALPEAERPKQGQAVHTNIVNHQDDYVEKSAESKAGGKVYSFENDNTGRQVQMRKLGDYTPVPIAHAPIAAETQHETAVPPVQASGPLNKKLSLKLVPGKMAAPMRIRVGNDLYTVTMNPEVHDIRDVLIAMQKGGVPVPSQLTKCILKVPNGADSRVISNISLTIQEAGLAKKTVILAEK